MLNDTEIRSKYAAERSKTKALFLCLAAAGAFMAIAGYETGITLLQAEGLALLCTGSCSAFLPGLGLGVFALSSIGIIGLFTITPSAIASAPTATGDAESMVSAITVTWLLAKFFLLSIIWSAVTLTDREREERRTAILERIRSLH